MKWARESLFSPRAILSAARLKIMTEVEATGWNKSNAPPHRARVLTSLRAG